MNNSPLPVAAQMSRRDFSRLVVGAGLAALASRPLFAAGGEAGSNVSLSIGTYGMKNLATTESLRLIKETGYDGVQLCVMAGWPADSLKMSPADRRLLRRQIEDSGLAIPS